MSSEPVRPRMSFWSLLVITLGFVAFFMGVGEAIYAFFMLDELPYWGNILMVCNSLLLSAVMLQDHLKKPA